jgi:hypothetical protein
VACASTDPKTVAHAIREQVWSVDRQIAVPEVRTMERILAVSVEKRRFQAVMLTVFAAAALLRAARGIHALTRLRSPAAAA